MRTAQFLDGVAASGMTPLDYLLSVMRDEAQPSAARLDAAKAAAPFVHPRRNAVTVEADIEVSRPLTKNELEAKALAYGIPLDVFWGTRTRQPAPRVVLPAYEIAAPGSLPRHTAD